MLNLREYQSSTHRLSDLLPWAALVAEGIILNKDGSFQRTIGFRGPDLESSTPPQLVAATARLNNALKRLGSGWAMFIQARRKKALGYPEEGHFPDPLSWLIDAERRDSFESSGNHYESVYYLTFLYLPPKETATKLSQLFLQTTQKNVEQNYAKALDFFSITVDRLFDIMKDFMFETAKLDDQETLTYLHSTISHRYHPVRVPEVPVYLDGVLADSPLTGGLEPKLGDQYLKTLSIMGFPSSSVPAILDQLNHLPLEYRWMTRFLPLDKMDAEKELKNYRRKWFAKRKGMLTLLSETISKSESAMIDSGSMRKSQDADAALQELADDFVSFGYYTATVTVWDSDLQVAEEKLREVERIINGLGFVTTNESINAVEAWLSSLPGQVYANVRMPLIHSLNLAHLIPFSALWAGPARNEHLKAPVLMYAKTAGNTPFRFSNYVGDVGHQMIIGPTGSGKSVFLNIMALQFLRYENAQVFIFDKGGSFLATTLSVNGEYYDVGSQDSRGLVFQPLAKIDQLNERIFASEWLLELLKNEKLEIDSELKENIWDALSNLANAPQHQRTLTGLSALVQNQKIRLALEPYCLAGAYGNILDADHETFKTKRFQCFEMQELMQTPEIIPPVLSYIFHALQKNFDGRPTLLVLDEAWLFLEHSIFSSKIKEWLKTLRKLNVSVIFATQSVDDTLSSSIASSLLESCPSRIFLPNDRALEPNIQEKYIALGLNDKQINIIAHAEPKRQYYFESHYGNALFDLNLSPLALAICSVSRPQDKVALLNLHNEVGDKNFLIRYLEYKKLNWAVKILKERGQYV
ncbi:MAG: conjugal transfer protein TrbE [Gammaproteobacteria bacterium]|nr:conjugal transfer protein TrbE [Gammaproteobacteria bacterium]